MYSYIWDSLYELGYYFSKSRKKRQYPDPHFLKTLTINLEIILLNPVKKDNIPYFLNRPYTLYINSFLENNYCVLFFYVKIIFKLRVLMHFK